MMKTETVAEKRLAYLRAAHTALENELSALTRRAYLTPHEQQRTRIIKKEKLHAKDTIRLLMTEFSMR